MERFNPSDPVTHEQVHALKKYLKKELQPLFEAAKTHTASQLIGSSGSFDSLAEMIAHRFHDIDVLKDKTEFPLNLEESNAIYHDLLKSSRAERLNMKGLIELRVDMIVVSAIFVHLILTSMHIENMRLSTYSLKEGALWELLHPAQVV